MKLTQIFCLGFAFLLGEITCQCVLPLSGHTKYSPLVTNPENITEILYPSPFFANPTIATSYSFLRISCPLGRLTVNSQETDDHVGFLTCVENSHKYTLLGHSNELYGFEAFSCSRFPDVVVEMTYESAWDNTMRAGIKTSVVQFFTILDFEFSRDLSYPERETTVSTIMRQHLKPMPANSSIFVKGAFYNSIDLRFDEIFRLSHQRAQFLLRWMDRQTVDRYFPRESDFYLAEAQLISKSELYYPFEQEASFLYENVVPVWRTIRDGNWKLVEKAMRKFAKQMSVEPVTLIAGTEGSLVFRSPNRHNLFEAYLTTEYHKLYAVPEKIFKCIVDRHDVGLALITLNNPHLKSYDIEPACRETTEDCQMMYPEFRDFGRGFTYCCDVNRLPDNLRSRCVAKRNIPPSNYYISRR